MEPATYTIEDPGPDILGKLLAAINSDVPLVSAEVTESEIKFRAATWRPILEARVQDAYAEVTGEEKPPLPRLRY